MKLFQYFLGCCLFLAALSSAAEVHIREVGLQGYVNSSYPQQLRVEISNSSPLPESFVLRIGQSSLQRKGVHVDYKIELQGKESRTLDLPVLLGSDFKVTVEQINSAGTVISTDEQDLNRDNSTLIAVVCAAQSACRAVSDAIRSSTTVEEQNAKEQQLRIVLLTDPPQNWFAYQPVSTLVVAGPVPNQAARDAIEDFARFGGSLVIASDQAPPDFLAAYHKAGNGRVSIGQGTVQFVNSGTSPEMRQRFAPEKVPQSRAIGIIFGHSEITHEMLLSWVGMQFEFPRLLWLIISMVVYIAVVGLLNFFVLRRIGKVEIGWLTVPAIALVFALMFYSFSVRGKMRHFTLDQATVCYMDDKSPVGVAEHGFRIASPQVRDLAFQVPLNAVVVSSGQGPLFRASDAAGIWNEDDRPRYRYSNLPEMTVDSAQHLPLEMLRLSYRDLQFRSVHQFPGTVHMERGVLTNSTGQNFVSAALVDYEHHKFYDLGSLAADASVQPLIKPADNLAQDPREMARPWINPQTNSHMKANFTLEEFLKSEYFSPHFQNRPLAFVGFTEQPLVTGKLEGISPDTKVYTIFQVTLEGGQ